MSKIHDVFHIYETRGRFYPNQASWKKDEENWNDLLTYGPKKAQILEQPYKKGRMIQPPAFLNSTVDGRNPAPLDR